MDDLEEGITPWYWNSRDSSKHHAERDAKRWDCLPRPQKRFRRSAAELHLPYEVRAALYRYGAHPSDWEPILPEYYGLRASDQVALFRRGCKEWEPLKQLNGVGAGEEWNPHLSVF